MEIDEQRKKLIERINTKAIYLRELDTRALVSRIEETENKLETSLREESSFKNLNAGFLCAFGSDCSEARRVIAELSARVPETLPGGDKKLTAPQKEAWLFRQRVENEELSATIGKQKDVAFQLDNFRIAVEMAKKRLESTKAVLGLKTAQILFLKD